MALTAKFCSSEDGAVAVDWVVLTAAVIGLALSVGAQMRSGLQDLSGQISASLSGATLSSVALFGQTASVGGNGNDHVSGKPNSEQTKVEQEAVNASATKCPSAFPNCDGVNPPPMKDAPDGGQPVLVAPTPPGTDKP